MTCKVITCCDLDDFPHTSSQSDNCPTGYYWDEPEGSCLRIPGDAMFNEDGEVILTEQGKPVLSECPNGYYWNENEQRCKRIPTNAIRDESGQVLLNEDGEPILEE